MGDFSANFQRQSMADGVFSLLRDQIISGQIPPGQKLTELDLVKTLGVSRTPIREALRLLLGEQLVEKRSSGGFSVTDVRMEDIRGIYNVRALLEGLMAREASVKLTTDDLEVLGEIIDRMHKVPTTDEQTIVLLGREFHAHIEHVAANRWAKEALQQIRGHIDRYRMLASRGKGRPVEAVREHQAIYSALVVGDAELAEHLMRQHVENSAGPALHVIEESFAARR
ncbi:GntR family transcriptional regulator [Compostimonas suwonensis]|uniref:DNA-binding GntR family transcriptional regulator n=1 Tax=Compostimonas suwonensis TaxID=1048394 RepID=A0A2M9BCD5_9MICO|nr:GntR family transcriptional regulator [Compostimonas suwonensis]PJJ55606.1 DNA-binding GntR family transcriptional regulator [Compostimonas suwonensis]